MKINGAYKQDFKLRKSLIAGLCSGRKGCPKREVPGSCFPVSSRALDSMDTLPVIAQTKKGPSPIATLVEELQIISQNLAPIGMPEFSQSLGFNLPDALARNVEILAHLFQGVILPVN